MREEYVELTELPKPGPRLLACLDEDRRAIDVRVLSNEGVLCKGVQADMQDAPTYDGVMAKKCLIHSVASKIVSHTT